MDIITWIEILLVLICAALLFNWLWKKAHRTVYLNQNTGVVTDKDGKVIGKVIDNEIEFFNDFWK